MSNKSEEFTIPAVLAFPSLITPSAPMGTTADPKFNTAVIVTNETYVNIIKPHLDQLILGYFVNNEASDGRFNWGFLPCTSKPATYPPELTPNMWYGNAKSGFKPELVDSAQMPIMDPNLIRDGANVYISIHLYAFNTAGNNGVGVGLGPVMYLKDGQALNVGGGVSAKDAFAGVQIDPSMAPAPVAPGVAVPGPAAAAAPAPGAPVPGQMAPAPAAPAVATPAAPAPAPGLPPMPGQPPQV